MLCFFFWLWHSGKRLWYKEQEITDQLTFTLKTWQYIWKYENVHWVYLCDTPSFSNIWNGLEPDDIFDSWVFETLLPINNVALIFSKQSCNRWDFWMVLYVCWRETEVYKNLFVVVVFCSTSLMLFCLSQCSHLIY